MQTISLYFPRRPESRAAHWSDLQHPAQPLLDVIIATVKKWRQRQRGRAELLQLDTRTLRDIGISRGDVLHEANKPFWRQ